MRKSRFIANKVVQLKREDAGLQRSIVRLHNQRVHKGQRVGGGLFRRNQPVAILQPDTKAKVIRFVMGTGSGVAGVTRDAIMLDYDAIDALGVPFDKPVELTVRAASFMEVLRWYYNHPDMGQRLSTRLGVTGAVLGFISLVPMLRDLALWVMTKLPW